MSRTRLLPIAALGAALALAVGACSDTDGAGPGRRSVTLPRIELAGALQPTASCDDLLAHLKEEGKARVTAWGLDGNGVFFTDDMAEGITSDMARGDGAGTPAPTTTGSSGTDVAYSETNNQVAGIDEPDSVKTDGSQLITVRDTTLEIVDVSTATPQRIASLPLGDEAFGGTVLVDDTTVFVLSSQWRSLRASNDTASPVVHLINVDISDPATPTIRETLDIEGTLLSARMLDGQVRLVVNTPAAPGIVFAGERAWDDDPDRLEQTNQALIDASGIEAWLPRYELTHADGVTDAGDLLPCDRVYEPATFSGFGVSTVITVDPSDGLALGDPVGVLGGSETMYSSATNLYVTTTAMPEPSDDAVIDDTTTEIHRFDFTNPATAEYRGSGAVEGWIIDQFAMDEFDGHLRVATTADFGMGDGPVDIDDNGTVRAPESESAVTVFAITDDHLESVGYVGDLGRGESIHSVRFIGTTGYVVTAIVRRDPLYVLDLTDPTAPTVTGELKIPGYSAYLHPMSDTALLGVGQDDGSNWNADGKLSLFDVSDPAHPTEIAKVNLADTWSVEADHHAFLAWAPTGLVAIPGHAGLQTFTVDLAAGSITTGGTIRHPEPIPSECVAPAAVTPPITVPECRSLSASPISRALVVGDRILTISEAGVMANELSSLGQLGWLAW